VRFGDPKYSALPDITWLVSVILQLWFFGLSLICFDLLQAPLLGIAFYGLSVLSWPVPLMYEMYCQWDWRLP